MQLCVGDIRRLIEENKLLDDTIISIEFPARLGIEKGEDGNRPLRTYGEGTSREIDVIRARGLMFIDDKVVIMHRTRR